MINCKINWHFYICICYACVQYFIESGNVLISYLVHFFSGVTSNILMFFFFGSAQIKHFHFIVFQKNLSVGGTLDNLWKHIHWETLSALNILSTKIFYEKWERKTKAFVPLFELFRTKTRKFFAAESLLTLSVANFLFTSQHRGTCLLRIFSSCTWS